MTFTRSLSTGNYGPAKFIVDGTTTANATHSTIAAAIASASAGDTVFIRNGTYTENLTLKIGVSLTAFSADGDEPNVTIIGKATASGAGRYSISNVRLQTNSDFFLVVSGSAATIVNLEYCYLNCPNNTGISFTTSSASAQINVLHCQGDLGTTGISYSSSSSAGFLVYKYCHFLNTGASTTVTTASAGNLAFAWSSINSPVSTTGTATFGAYQCNFDSSAQNATCLTIAGSGNGTLVNSQFNSGTASAVVATATCGIYSCAVSSSNTNIISGAGTLNYSGISAVGSGFLISTTTQAGNKFYPGITLSSEQPAFSAYLATTKTNKTGTGTTYTLGADALTEVFDQNGDFNTNGTFTAPFTGKYDLSAGAIVTGCTIAATLNLSFVSSNRTYVSQFARAAGASNICSTISALADMDAADTCTVGISCVGEAGDTDDIYGDANMSSFFTGVLTC